MFVNSQSYENEAFYGIAIASADASVKGLASDLIVDGEIESERRNQHDYLTGVWPR